jgi:DNA-binding response OmpR family regulator
MNHHSPHPVSHGPKRRILIVENDQDLIDIYSTRLETEGFVVASLKDGDKVYHKIVEFKPDMVLLDIRLGRYDGLDILEDLRHRPETKNTKVIVITVLALDTVEDRAKKLGVLEYLVKTTTVLADIVEHIKEHLGMATPLEEDLTEEKLATSAELTF